MGKDKTDKANNFLIEIYKGYYEKLHNPMYVWESIEEIENRSSLNDKPYPGWIKNYLLQVAADLMKLSHGAKTDVDITAALGFSDLRQLYRPNRTKMFIALMYMDEMIDDGKSRESAALDAENYLNKKGFQYEYDQKKKGYLGNAILEKLYREFRSIKEEALNMQMEQGEEDNSK
ncbi:MAG: hypothetical protein SCH71_16620 [Desulfobulbaceae bacterium]|nr:hypothetical protein [Desulfobulbaceae bacterium]